MSIDELYEINNRNNTSRCVAFCDDKYIGKCFAVSGVKNNRHRKIITSLIKDVLGHDCTECLINEAIFCLARPMPEFIKRESELSFYQNLTNCRGSEYIENFLSRVGLFHFGDPYFDDYLFSCVERKILGHWLLVHKNTKMPTLYVTLRPCYYCLPAIDKTFYIDFDNSIHGIKKTFQIGSLKGFKEVKIK